MKVSLNWLSELVELPASVPALCELLTQAGVEVEEIQTRGVAIDKVVVAQVLESVQHPNADRLSVCKIDDGSGLPRQIVCGAKNYKVGDKVPVALPGAVLPGDFRIKIGKLRGVESEGMLCSSKELGLGEGADGLLILPETAQPGTPISQLFPAETILDLEVTPNRPDLLSHVGMAREIAALTGNPLKAKPVPTPSTVAGDVTIGALDLCPFYTARKIASVKVGPSPAWLRDRLEAVGLRAINNIVDITNLVMLELGQPLHAFDAAKLNGPIQVRTANEGEGFLALDGRTYRLNSQHLVISDQQRAIAIAGVMGGEETGVTEATTDIILESAYFQPSSIRRTARGLGLASDSSYRFERGVDPEGVLRASQRATELILEIADGQAAETIAAGAMPDFSCTVTLRPNRCSEILGTEIPSATATAILSGLGLEQEGDSWRIPSYRQDLRREIDLIEEVTRVFGIENIPGREVGRFTASSSSDKAHDREMKLRQILIGQGFYETRTLTLVGESAAEFGGNVLRVRNPLTEDQVVLRPNLTGGLLGVVANNARVGVKSLRLFEIGRVFQAGEVEETTHLGLVMTGALRGGEADWRSSENRMADFFDLKGVLASLGLGELAFETIQDPSLALAVEIKSGGARIGSAGQVWPAKAREMDISSPMVIAEIDLLALQPAPRGRYEEINKFPAISRDIAVIVPLNITHRQIASTLEQGGEPLLTNVKIFDVFTDPSGEKIEADRKSLAYSLTYRAKDRTLTSDEANAAHARLKEQLKLELGVQFRE